MGKELILAIDQGTTGTTCLLVNEHLNIVATQTVPFPQYYPHPGEVEHNPEEIWQSVLSAIEKLLSNKNVSPAHIAAIGITNQRETIVVWDKKSGKPIYPAIVWQDKRTAAVCEKLSSITDLEPTIAKQTGLILDPYFSATKIAWILDEVAGAQQKAKRGELAVGTVDSFLLWKLTDGAVHATDPSNACRTFLWPLEGGDWSQDLCSLFQVPRAILPAVHPSNTTFGTTKGVPGLPDGIPISGIIGDQQSALFAQTCFEKGEAKCTFGTGAFLMVNTGATPIFSHNRLLTSVGWQINHQTTYCLEGSAFMAGAAVQWLADGLGIIDSPTEIESLARQVTSSSGVVFIPAHAGLGAPHWNPDARGMIAGMTRGTTKAHIARAALEGIALQTNDLITAMAKDMEYPITSLKVDGGAAVNNLLLQIQADLLNIPVLRPANLETTSLGAVFMAGLGIEMWTDMDSLNKAWRIDREFIPAKNSAYTSDIKRNWNLTMKQM